MGFLTLGNIILEKLVCVAADRKVALGQQIMVNEEFILQASTLWQRMMTVQAACTCT